MYVLSRQVGVHTIFQKIVCKYILKKHCYGAFFPKDIISNFEPVKLVDSDEERRFLMGSYGH